MWQPVSLFGAGILLLAARQLAASDGPAVITNVSPYGVGPVTISSTAQGYDIDLGNWPDVANFGCNFVHVDIDVRDGGTLTTTYNVRQSPQSDSFMDVYLLEPGVTWDPGTTWNESGTERCFRNDFPAGVVPIEGPIDAWGYPTWQTPDFPLSVPLGAYTHQTVRLVFRQWSWGTVYGESIQTRLRSLTVGAPPSVSVTDANIETDQIAITLAPSGTQGDLVVTLVGDTNYTVFTGVKPAGAFTFPFGRDALPEGQYTSVTATWSGASGSKPVSFLVMGRYRHSQYNTPNEQACTGAAAAAYITDTQCTFQSATLKSDFIGQSWLNGSGITTQYGSEQNEAFCLTLKKPKPPKDAAGRSFRPQTILGSCGSPVGNSTVARGDDAPLICGDEILIIGVGGAGTTTKKTVSDRCPACTGRKQIDNYTTTPACQRGTIGDLAGTTLTTIRLR